METGGQEVILPISEHQRLVLGQGYDTLTDEHFGGRPPALGRQACSHRRISASDFIVRWVERRINIKWNAWFTIYGALTKSLFCMG